MNKVIFISYIMISLKADAMANQNPALPIEDHHNDVHNEMVDEYDRYLKNAIA